MIKEIVVALIVAWLIIALINVIISVYKDKRFIIDDGLLVALMGGPLALVELIRRKNNENK